MLKYEFDVFYYFFNAKFFIDYLRTHTSAYKFFLIIDFYSIYYSIYYCFLFTKTFKLFNF